MSNYETDLSGYWPLIYVDKKKKLRVSEIYMINVEKIRIINKNTKLILKFITNAKGYYHLPIHGEHQSLHRLMWIHCRGLIPKNLEIDHIDDNKQNNSIHNLQLLTHNENNLKRLKRLKLKKVKTINIITNEEIIYESIKICSEKLKIDNRRISDSCNNRKGHKIVNSKKDNQRYKFQYI
jgi:hypothetical protein